MPVAPRRVLVVDDDEDTAKSLSELLKLMGHHATFVTDSAKVDDCIVALEPHIAFLDIGMPGLNGWQLATHIRSKYPPEVLRLVAVTGYGTMDDRANSRRAGFDAHLLKPASIDLVESIFAQFYSATD